MGFFGALSALAQPGYQIAGAQDALRKQQEDSALKQAQTSVHQMAAEGARQQNAFAAREEQERQTVRQQLGIPLRKHKDANGADYTDYWTPSGVKSLPDAPSSEDRFKSYLDSAEKSGLKLTPEQKEALMPEFYGVKAPATLSYKNIPGAAGQPQERVGSDGKKTYVRMMYDPSTNSNVEQPMPPGYTPPAPKPGAPRPGISKGKNVFGFYNPGKSQWQDAAGNTLADFQPQPTFAETGMYEPMAAYDPQSQSIALGSFNKRNGRLTFTNGAGSATPLPPAIAATIGKEFGNAREAQTRLKIMQQNAAEAYQGNQQAMVSLLMNHIGMTLGAQKGTRVAKSVIDEARQSAPWLDTKLVTMGHQDQNGDFVYDGPKGGINLAGEQIKQMVDLAKQRNDLQWQQVKDTGATYGVDLSGAIQQTQAGGVGGTGGGGAKVYKQTATGPGGHKIGSDDGGVTWYDTRTGKKI